VRHRRRFRAIKNFSGDVDRCAQRHPLKRSGHALLLHEPTGQNYTFVIRLMARVVAFLGRASGSARRTSVVNTALSYGFVNCSPVDVTEAS
jgi:hypothetical protein